MSEETQVATGTPAAATTDTTATASTTTQDTAPDNDDALFDSLLANKGGTAAAPPVKPQPTPDVSAAAKTLAAAKSGGEAKPEPAAKAPDKPQAPAATKPAAAADPDWSKLPEGLRAPYEQAYKDVKASALRFEADNRSILGRVPGLQRRLAELEHENASLRQQSQTAAPAKSAAAAPPATDSASLDSDPEWKQALADFPEVAKPADRLLRALQSQFASKDQEYRQRIDDLTARLEEVGGAVGESQDFADEIARRDAVSELTRRHSDWRDHCLLTKDDQGNVRIKHLSQPMQDFLNSRHPLSRAEHLQKLMGGNVEAADASLSEMKEWHAARTNGDAAKAAAATANREREIREARAAHAAVPATNGRAQATGGQFDPTRFASEDELFDALQSMKRA